ncbi:terminase large subunit, nuclease domain [Arthrobacter phage DanielleIgnace]|nr:terminase large subunit, nuclease domain [Arthrobacter phage DanielleIgnace]
MTEQLGFRVKPQIKEKAPEYAKATKVRGVNTRTSLWPTRWPAIAKQECIDEVESAAPEDQALVKFELPCQDCELNAACLNAKKKELGSLMYDREILTNPRSSQSSLFPGELIEPMKDRSISLVPFWHKPFSLEHHFRTVQAWDIAWSEKIGGDYLVCMTGMIDLRNGQRTLLDIERWQGKSFDTQVKMIESKWLTYQADMVVIESDVSQVIWSQHVGRNTSVPVKAHAAGGEKQDLAVGVPSILIRFENRKWTFPYMEGTQRFEEVENFFGELEAFGWVDGKLQGIGEHDDTVMCFWHLDWGLDQFALASGGGGDEHRRGNVPGARQ